MDVISTSRQAGLMVLQHICKYFVERAHYMVKVCGCVCLCVYVCVRKCQTQAVAFIYSCLSNPPYMHTHQINASSTQARRYPLIQDFKKGIEQLDRQQLLSLTESVQVRHVCVCFSIA